MTMERHSARAGSACVAGILSTAALRRFATSWLPASFSTSSKLPNGTVTDAGSAMDSGS